MRSGVGIGLVGIVLAVIFLLYFAVKLNDLPLYIVCGIGITLMVIAFWRDEVKGGGGGGA